MQQSLEILEQSVPDLINKQHLALPVIQQPLEVLEQIVPDLINII